MRQDWEPEDLIEVWTLLEDDMKKVRNKSGATRLGFALLLKFFEVEARFPESAKEMPAAAVEYVAQQVKVPAGAWADYDWQGDRIKRHRKEIREAYGFRANTEEDQDQHPRTGAPEVRGGAAHGAGDQGARPALPGHPHRVRDEAARPRCRRTHRARRPPHRPRPGPGDARRAPARHLRPDRRRAKLLFAFFAAMAETERENIRESTLEGLDTAARKGKHGGRPPVITDDMLHTVLRRRAHGESVEQIQPDLIIPTGKRKGQNPSIASIYRALAEHDKTRGVPRSRRTGPRRLRRPPGQRTPRPACGDGGGRPMMQYCVSLQFAASLMIACVQASGEAAGGHVACGGYRIRDDGERCQLSPSMVAVVNLPPRPGHS